MGMGLQWAICLNCGVSKPLQKSGAMCIHVDADSVRCPGSGVPTKPLPVATPRPDPNRYKRGHITPPEVLDSEIEAAFAAIKRKGRSDPAPDAPIDRRIYAVRGVHTVRGGLPGHGRNH